jgi:hypothetical protein
MQQQSTTSYISKYFFSINFSSAENIQVALCLEEENIRYLYQIFYLFSYLYCITLLILRV